MKGWFVALLFAMVIVGGAMMAPDFAAPQGQPKVAFVDLARVMAKSAAGAAAREQLEKDRAGMQKELDGRSQEVTKLKEELEKKGKLMAEDVRKEKEDLLERKARDARRMVDDLRKELEKKEVDVGQKILKDIMGLVDGIGKRGKYQLILERRQGGVVYASPEADITDEVIKAYDQDALSKVKK